MVNAYLGLKTDSFETYQHNYFYTIGIITAIMSIFNSCLIFTIGTKYLALIKNQYVMILYAFVLLYVSFFLGFLVTIAAPSGGLAWTYYNMEMDSRKINTYNNTNKDEDENREVFETQDDTSEEDLNVEKKETDTSDEDTSDEDTSDEDNEKEKNVGVIEEVLETSDEETSDEEEVESINGETKAEEVKVETIEPVEIKNTINEILNDTINQVIIENEKIKETNNETNIETIKECLNTECNEECKVKCISYKNKKIFDNIKDDSIIGAILKDTMQEHKRLKIVHDFS
jgi:hypothetical protein